MEREVRRAGDPRLMDEDRRILLRIVVGELSDEFAAALA